VCVSRRPWSLVLLTHTPSETQGVMALLRSSRAERSEVMRRSPTGSHWTLIKDKDQSLNGAKSWGHPSVPAQHTHTHTSYNLHVQNRPLPTALRIIDQLAHPNDFTLDFMKIISNSQRLIMTNITINFHQLNIIVQFPLHCSVVIQNTPFVISEMIMINHSQPFPFHQRRT